MSQFIWGDEPSRGEIGGIRFLLYEPRRHRIPELLEDAERWRDRVHLVQGGRHLTFAHVFATIDQLAARLTGMGVGPGDRLLLLAANSPEWVISVWAGLPIGAIVASGNGWWSAEDVEHAIGLVELRREAPGQGPS
jgi:long-chain acyl-CoA synthetase